MYVISKQFAFSASHFIGGLPDDHKCSRRHGHNYIVEIVCQAGELDSRGFVVDYGDLAPIKHYVDSTLDHRDLNEVLGHNKTTAEVLAKHIFDLFKDRYPLAVVRVSETPKTWAEYHATMAPPVMAEG